MSNGTFDTMAKALDYAEVSGQALAEAEKMAQAQLQTEERVAEVAPKIAQQLVDSHLIDETEKQAAVRQLSDPEGALKIASNILKYLGEQKQAYEKKIHMYNQGHGIDGEKTASARPRSTEDPYVGRRRGLGERAASDLPLLKLAGLNQ